MPTCGPRCSFQLPRPPRAARAAAPLLCSVARAAVAAPAVFRGGARRRPRTCRAVRSPAPAAKPAASAADARLRRPRPSRCTSSRPRPRSSFRRCLPRPRRRVATSQSQRRAGRARHCSGGRTAAARSGTRRWSARPAPRGEYARTSGWNFAGRRASTASRWRSWAASGAAGDGTVLKEHHLRWRRRTLTTPRCVRTWGFKFELAPHLRGDAQRRRAAPQPLPPQRRHGGGGGGGGRPQRGAGAWATRASRRRGCSRSTAARRAPSAGRGGCG